MALLLPTQTREVAQTIFSGSQSITQLSPLFGNADDTTTPQKEIQDDIVNKKPFDTIETTAKAIIEVIAPSKKEAVVRNDDALTVANIIDATNTERIAAGLTPLTTNTLLSASAKLKTDDMIKNGYFEHVSPAGVTVSDLGNTVGYNYVIMGENLALGNFTGANDLVRAWMDSPGHKANILSTSYMEIGIYAAQGTYQGRKVWFAVQHFGTTRGACPAVSTSLKSDIDSFNRSLRGKEKEIIAMRAELEAASNKSSQEYMSKVSTFNALVAQYNADLAVSQQFISRYNKQVVAFNSCLSKYQKAE